MLDALAAASKALLYAGLLSGAGAALAGATLSRSSESSLLLAQVIRRGAVLTLIAGAAGALILILRLGGQFDEATLSAVFLSGTGAALCLQLAGAGLLLASISIDPLAHGTHAGNAALAISSFAFSGHPAASGPAAGLVAFLHVGAAAWWVGSLWLLRDACARSDLAAVAMLVRRFSVIAAGVIGALLLAGLVLLLVLVDFSRTPWLTPYGQILAIKISFAILVLGIAIYNKFRLTPRLSADDPAAASQLRRMIGGELALIGAVLATTAILTIYVSPFEDVTNS